MDMDKQHGHGLHATWAWIYSKSMPTAWTRKCSMDMQVGHEHAVVHGHVGWTLKCSMNMDMEIVITKAHNNP
jgi:hypothetical protein